MQGKEEFGISDVSGDEEVSRSMVLNDERWIDVCSPAFVCVLAAVINCFYQCLGFGSQY